MGRGKGPYEGEGHGGAPPPAGDHPPPAGGHSPPASGHAQDQKGGGGGGGGGGEGTSLGPGAGGGWKVGLFDCFRSCKFCCCSACCPCCLAKNIAGAIDENGIVYCALVCFVNPVGVTLLRKTYRKHQSIEGELLEDFIWGCCCGPCVLCQMGNDLAERDVDI